MSTRQKYADWADAGWAWVKAQGGWQTKGTYYEYDGNGHVHCACYTGCAMLGALIEDHPTDFQDYIGAPSYVGDELHSQKEGWTSAWSDADAFVAEHRIPNPLYPDRYCYRVIALNDGKRWSIEQISHFLRTGEAPREEEA